MQWTQVDTGKTTELGPETGVENRLLRAVQTGAWAGTRPLFFILRGNPSSRVQNEVVNHPPDRDLGI